MRWILAAALAALITASSLRADDDVPIRRYVAEAAGTLTIEPDGTVSATTLPDALHPSLRDAFTAAIRRWTFEPIHVDGEAVRACITSVSDVVGREVTTIEGLHPTGDHAVQKAWRQLNVPQCGFCQAGQIMQAAALLIEDPKPNHDKIREAMAGNICRCGCYQRIENAVHLASTGV